MFFIVCGIPMMYPAQLQRRQPNRRIDLKVRLAQLCTLNSVWAALLSCINIRCLFECSEAAHKACTCVTWSPVRCNNVTVSCKWGVYESGCLPCCTPNRASELVPLVTQKKRQVGHRNIAQEVGKRQHQPSQHRPSRHRRRRRPSRSRSA